MNCALRTVDKWGVSQWLATFRRVLPGMGGPHRAVRAAIERAARRDQRLELETIAADGSRGDLLLTTIELVRDHDLVISRPTLGSTMRPLVTGEPLQICLAGKRGRVIGETRCLGRIKIPRPSEESGMLYGYRLALPETLEDTDRREQQRVPVEFDLAPQAELLLPRRGRVLRGILVDISVSGVRMRCTGGFDVLNKDDEVLLKTVLPHPVGELTEFVRVRRVEHCLRTDHCVAAMAFLRPINNIGKLVRQLELNRLQRRRAG